MGIEELFSKVRESFITSFSFLLVLKAWIQCHLSLAFNFAPLEIILSNKHLVECKFSYSRLFKAVSSWNLAILKDGDSKTSLGNILQYSFTFTVWFLFSSRTRISCISICAQILFSFTFLIIFCKNLCFSFFEHSYCNAQLICLSYFLFSPFSLLNLTSYLSEYQLLHFCGLNE